MHTHFKMYKDHNKKEMMNIKLCMIFCCYGFFSLRLQLTQRLLSVPAKTLSNRQLIRNIAKAFVTGVVVVLVS